MLCYIIFIYEWHVCIYSMPFAICINMWYNNIMWFTFNSNLRLRVPADQPMKRNLSTTFVVYGAYACVSLRINKWFGFFLPTHTQHKTIILLICKPLKKTIVKFMRLISHRLWLAGSNIFFSATEKSKRYQNAKLLQI